MVANISPVSVLCASVHQWSERQWDCWRSVWRCCGGITSSASSLTFILLSIFEGNSFQRRSSQICTPRTWKQRMAHHCFSCLLSGWMYWFSGWKNKAVLNLKQAYWQQGTREGQRPALNIQSKTFLGFFFCVSRKKLGRWVSRYYFWAYKNTTSFDRSK